MAQHLSPHDVVPPLREDLEPLPEPSGTGTDVITLAPVEGAGAMRMHGFELSIARMLDGRRTAHDVLVNSKRLGLPLTLDALEDFVFQLRTHGLLGAKPLSDARLDWPPAARELFRDAIRAAREGHFDRARRHLDAMRELVPGAEEPSRLRQWLDAHPDPVTAGSTFGETFQHTLDAWSQERPAHWHVAADVRDTLRRSWWPIVGPLTAIGFLIAYILLPRPHWVHTVADLSPAETVAIAAPGAGVLHELMVKPGDHVAPGAPLFSYGAKELQDRLSALQQQLDQTRAPMRAAFAKTPEGKPLAEALDRAQDELSSAEGVLAEVKRDAETKPGDPRLVGAEERVAKARAGVETARSTLDARLPEGSPGVQEARKLDEQVKALNQQLAEHTVKAQVAGVVTDVKVAAGEPIEPGQSVLQLEDRGRMKMVAPMSAKNARGVQVGTPITVRLGQERMQARVSEIVQGEIVAELPNPDGELKPGPVAVQVQVPPRPKKNPPSPP